MATTIPTRAALEAQILAFLRNRFSGRDLGSESFLGKFARALTLSLLGLIKAVADADNDSTPTSNTSTAALDSWAELLGLPSGTTGVYGRKGATAGTGGAALCTGTKGTIYADQALLTASDGTTLVLLDGSVTITGVPPGTGSIAGVFDASTEGTIGNLAIGEVLTWQSPPAGADSTVTLTTAISGGTDEESDAALLERILERLQSPSKGGTASDYRGWAETVSGVIGFAYPLRQGLGSCDVVITQAGSGTSRDPGAATKTSVDDYINGSATQEGQRTVTSEGYTTLRPYMPTYAGGPGNIGGLTIRARMVPSADKYAFDWDDTAATYTVDTVGVTTVKLNTLAPATLKAAIDAGDQPRLQILCTSTGFPHIPVQVRVTAYADAGGKTTLTYEVPLPDGHVEPTVGDRVYAGGPMVDDIANAILDYIDGLGPSRAGGYADTQTVWEDTAAIARIGQIALNVTDDDGVPFAENVVAAGVTIANGSNAAAATDVQASDSTSNGPELLWVRHVAVTD